LDCAKELLKFGADVDAEDMIGRPPLLFAVENKDFEMIKLLLSNGALPWSTENLNYNQLAHSHPDLHFLITRARKLHIIIKMTRPAVRD
jgi:ankyrin repeat protein